MATIQGTTEKGGIKQWLFRANGLARVEAVSLDKEEQSAQDGESYIFHAECHTAAATSGTLLYIKNNSTVNSIHVTRIYIDPQSLTPTDLFLTQGISPTSISSGTDVTSTNIIQKNTGKVNALKDASTMTISDGSADITLTGGTVFHKFPVASRTSSQRNMNGTNVIAPGGEWYIGYTSAGGATNGEVISLSVNAYVAETDPE